MISLAVVMAFLSSTQINLGIVIGKKILFFVIILWIAQKVVPWFLNKFALFKVTEVVISAGIILCLLFSYIAEYFGVAGIIGAFIAGIAISRTDYKKEVENKIEPIAYAIFVPIFFVSIGLSVSFTGLGEHIWFIIAFSLIAIFTKWLGAGLGAKLTGFNMLSSLRIGAGMISRGEVALILALLGLESQLLEQKYFTSILIIVIIPTLVMPPMLKIFFKDKEKNNTLIQ
jgi:Kef-type K+ transport system membrane component KefB